MRFGRSLKFERHSSKVVCEGFVLMSLVASLLTKPRFTPRRGQEMKCVYWKVSVGLGVKDRVSLKSIPFVYYCVKESYFLFSNFSCQFD